MQVLSIDIIFQFRGISREFRYDSQSRRPESPLHSYLCESSDGIWGKTIELSRVVCILTQIFDLNLINLCQAIGPEFLPYYYSPLSVVSRILCVCDWSCHVGH